MTSDAKILELLNGKDSQALAAVVADTVVTMPEWVLIVTAVYCTKQHKAATQAHKDTNTRTKTTNDQQNNRKECSLF